MNAQSPLFQIEARRIEAGISREALAIAAGLSRSAYDRAITGSRAPRSTTIGALRSALSRLARVQGASDDLTRLVGSLFNAALALICAREGISTVDVLRHDPARKATSDPAWLRAAHLRAQAIALVNQGLDLPQSELARALNLTPAAVSRAMGKVEDERHRDGALDRWMDQQERMLRGEV